MLMAGGYCGLHKEKISLPNMFFSWESHSSLQTGILPSFWLLSTSLMGGGGVWIFPGTTQLLYTSMHVFAVEVG